MPIGASTRNFDMGKLLCLLILIREALTESIGGSHIGILVGEIKVFFQLLFNGSEMQLLTWRWFRRIKPLPVPTTTSFIKTDQDLHQKSVTARQWSWLQGVSTSLQNQRSKFKVYMGMYKLLQHNETPESNFYYFRTPKIHGAAVAPIAQAVLGTKTYHLQNFNCKTYADQLWAQIK